MGGIKVFEMKGHREIIDRFNKADRLIVEAGKPHMRRLGNFAVEAVKLETLNAHSVDTNELIQGIHQTIKSKRGGVTSVVAPSKKADKYASFVEYGTKPHVAPISALKGWAERHGIPVGAVWWSIKTKGTKGRFIFRKAFVKIKHESRETAIDIATSIVNKI